MLKPKILFFTSHWVKYKKKDSKQWETYMLRKPSNETEANELAQTLFKEKDIVAVAVEDVMKEETRQIVYTRYKRKKK